MEKHRWLICRYDNTDCVWYKYIDLQEKWTLQEAIDKKMEYERICQNEYMILIKIME